MMMKKMISLFSMIGLFVSMVASSFALSLTIEWDPSLVAVDGVPLSSPSSYRLFYGGSSGVYSESVVVSAGTAVTISDLEYNQSYFFAAKAYGEGAESEFSEELSWVSPRMPDEDMDDISDDWELAHFDALDMVEAFSDFDLDGASDQAEFVAGTDPVNAQDFPAVAIRGSGQGVVVEFQMHQAEGSGYENRTRFYTLKKCDDLAVGNWVSVPLVENIPATDQLKTHSVDVDNGSVCYRAEIELR